MGFLNAIASHPQLILMVFFLAAPVVKAIAKSFEKNKRERELKVARERAEAEALRTGRPVSVIPEPAGVPAQASPAVQNARQRLEDRAAARRAAQMQAQQRPRTPLPAAGRAPATQPRSTPTPEATPGMIKLRLPNGKVIQVPDPNAKAPVAPAREAKRAARPAKPEQRAPVPRSEEAPTERAPRVRAAEARAAEEARLAPVPPPVPARGGLLRQSAGQWRRTIMLMEVLGTPPGMQ